MPAVSVSSSLEVEPPRRHWQHRHTILLVLASTAIGLAGFWGLTQAIAQGHLTLVPVWALMVFIGLSGLSLTRFFAWLLSK